jgi:hypothetical protein
MYYKKSPRVVKEKMMLLADKVSVQFHAHERTLPPQAAF